MLEHQMNGPQRDFRDVLDCRLSQLSLSLFHAPWNDFSSNLAHEEDWKQLHRQVLIEVHHHCSLRALDQATFHQRIVLQAIVHLILL